DLAQGRDRPEADAPVGVLQQGEEARHRRQRRGRPAPPPTRPGVPPRGVQAGGPPHSRQGTALTTRPPKHTTPLPTLLLSPHYTPFLSAPPHAPRASLRPGSPAGVW